MLWQRVVTAAVLIPLIIVAVLLLDSPGLALLLGALAPLRRAGGTAALGIAALARYPQLTML